MSVIWFRKCLRVHDNPSLIAAIESKQPILPIFILDPNFIKNGRCGINRWNFLFESLKDLNQSFEKLGSTLTVFRGSPTEIFEMLFNSKKVKNLYFEQDTEPYSIIRDNLVKDLCKREKINLQTFLGHTLYDPQEIIRSNNGKAPVQYNRLITIMSSFPKLKECARDPIKSQIIPFKDILGLTKSMNYKGDTSIPTVKELIDKNYEKFTEQDKPTAKIKGGESQALIILEEYLKDKKKVANFEKPKTSPAAFDPPSTTTLSPYLKFGCLSAKRFYHELQKILKEVPKHSQPPCSLLGQLYWREFFYCASVGIPNFHKMENNSICKQVDWMLKLADDEDKIGKAYLTAWSNGNTGYPWIDAIMKQLRIEGWIHHLARHSVACFLTRGDLYVNWERGLEVFEELLLDADYALNAGNWLWLSGSSSFFTAYFRIYSPVAFPKKYDPNGDFVRKYLPVLKDMPKEFIYEPWKAPKSLQEKIGCLVGRDYPERIIDHDEINKINIAKLSQCFGKKKLNDQVSNEEDDDDENINKKRSKSEIKISTSKIKIENKSIDDSKKNIKPIPDKEKKMKISKKKIESNQTQISKSFINQKIGEKRNFKETGYKFEEVNEGVSKKIKR